jgi:hypothetical protein
MDLAQVHIAHCCGVHGCKYGNDECGVAAGTLEQKHPCEFCTLSHPEQDKTVDAIVAWLEMQVTKHFTRADLLEEAGAVEVANSSRERASYYQDVVRGIKSREWKK